MRYFYFIMYALFSCYFFIKRFLLLFISNKLIFKLSKQIKHEKNKITIFKYLTKVWLYLVYEISYKINNFILKLHYLFIFKRMVYVFITLKFNIMYYINIIFKYTNRFNLSNKQDKVIFLRLLKMFIYIYYIIIYYILYIIYYIAFGLYLAVYYTLFAFYIVYRIILNLPRIIFETIKGLLVMSFQIIWYIVSSLVYMFFNLFLDVLHILFNLPKTIRKFINLIISIKNYTNKQYQRFKFFLKFKLFVYMYDKYTILKSNIIWGSKLFFNWILHPKLIGLKRFWYWSRMHYIRKRQRLVKLTKYKFYNYGIKFTSLYFYNMAHNLYWFTWVTLAIFVWLITIFLLVMLAYSFYDYVAFNQYETDKKTKAYRYLCAFIMYCLIVIIISLLFLFILSLILAISFSN